MPNLSDAQLDLCPGATGERHETFGGVGARLRAAMRGGPCVIPVGDDGRLARQPSGQYVDPHEWEATAGHPGWLHCRRCPSVTTTAELVAADERYAASQRRR